MGNKCTFEFVASYPILGEEDNGEIIDAHRWMTERLELAYQADDITAGRVLNVAGGTWGLQYVTFIGEIEMYMEHSMKATKEKLRKKLNKIVRDTDVELHWINRTA